VSRRHDSGLTMCARVWPQRQRAFFSPTAVALLLISASLLPAPRSVKVRDRFHATRPGRRRRLPRALLSSRPAAGPTLTIGAQGAVRRPSAPAAPRTHLARRLRSGDLAYGRPRRHLTSWGSRTAPGPATPQGEKPSCMASSRGVTSLRPARPQRASLVWPRGRGRPPLCVASRRALGA